MGKPGFYQEGKGFNASLPWKARAFSLPKKGFRQAADAGAADYI